MSRTCTRCPSLVFLLPFRQTSFHRLTYYELLIAALKDEDSHCSSVFHVKYLLKLNFGVQFESVLNLTFQYFVESLTVRTKITDWNSCREIYMCGVVKYCRFCNKVLKRVSECHFWPVNKVKYFLKLSGAVGSRNRLLAQPRLITIQSSLQKTSCAAQRDGKKW